METKKTWYNKYDVIYNINLITIVNGYANSRTLLGLIKRLTPL